MRVTPPWLRLLTRRAERAAVRGDCLVWLGSPFVVVDGREVEVERVVWGLSHGSPPPRAARVVRSCAERRCITPEHLRLDWRHFPSDIRRLEAQAERLRRLLAEAEAKLRERYGIAPTDSADET